MPGSPAVPAAPKTVAMAQVAYINPPNAIYPTRSRRAGEKGRVLLRVTYCPAGQACRPATLPFAWDGRLGRFVGADRAARNSLAHTGAAEPDSTPIPDVPARSGNR